MSLRERLEQLPISCFQNSSVIFRPIKTESDIIYAVLDCKLSDEQKELVNPAWFSIGRAYLCRDNNYPCLICNGKGERIGFINLCKWLGMDDAFSWSYFIDTDWQGKGYGKQAALLAISILKTVDPSGQIKLSTEKYNAKAQRLYTSLGFRQLEEMDGDDLVFGL